MKRFLSVILSLMLVVTLLPPLQASANEDIPFDEYGFRTDVKEARQQLLATDEWVSFPSKPNVALDKEWKINFSDIATPNKIKAMTIEHNGQEVPVLITYGNSTSKIVKVKPRSNLLGGQKHTLNILLVNGKKYKMDFTTAQRTVDIEPNNNYSTAKELYIGEIIQGNLSVNDKTDFYKIKVARDGQLDVNIKGLASNNISLYLYDQDGDDGDLLAYTDDKTSIRLDQELKAGEYYIRVTGSGNYEITTSHTPKSVNSAKALQDAQKAVNALPAPLDVTAAHSEKIKEATVRVAAAKALGADAVEIEILEAILEELQKVALPLEIASATVLNSTTFEVRFNRAVDESVALFEVKQGATVKQAQVSFNANKTAARVELDEKLTKATYTMSVEGLVDGKLTATVDADKEQVESIEILSKKAVRIAGNQVSVPYKAENQYGEEMMDASLTVTATGTVVDTSLTSKVSEGTVKIPIQSNVQEGDSIVLELKANGKSVKETVTVSTQASVMGISMHGIYNAKGETLKETTVLDTEVEEDQFYLLIKATDQHGSEIDNIDILNVPNAIRLVSEDASIVKFGSITDLKLIEKTDGTEAIGLKLTGTPKLGETEVTLTAMASGKKATYTVKVAEGTRTDVIELDVPLSIVADEELFIPITAWDKENNFITGTGEAEEIIKIIKNPVSGVEFTITPNIPYTIKEGKVPGEIGILLDKSKVVEGSFTIKAESSTGKITTEKITVKEKAVPTTWEEISTDPIRKNINLKDNDQKNPQLINNDKVQFIDQHGKPIEPTAGYSLVVTDENPKGGAVSVTGNEITPIAVGTEEVTIGIKRGNEVVQGSEQTIRFTVTDNSGYIRYEVAPIGTVYDALGAGKTSSDKYDKEVVVLGVLENGEKEKLKSTDYEIKEIVGYLEITPAGKLHVTGAFYYDGNKTEHKRSIEIEIKSSGEVLNPEVTFSKVEPKVTELKVSQGEIKYDASVKKTFSLAKLVNSVEILAIDQYGVPAKEKLTGTSTDQFPDGTTIQSKLLLNAISDGTKPTDNELTELPKGLIFNAVVTAGSASTTVKVTVTEGDTPEADAAKVELDSEAAKITQDNLGPIVNSGNLVAKAQGLVVNGFTVTIRSSSHPNIITTDGKVTQQAQDERVTVVFTVTKGKYSVDTVALNLDVDQAPPIDKSLLEAAITRAWSAYVEVSSDGTDLDSTKKWTTSADKAKLESVLATAETVNITIASQLEVDGAVKALEAAINLYIKAQKPGTGPTGVIGAVSISTPYVAATPEIKAEFQFAVITALHEDDTLEIGAEEFKKVTDVASIVARINGTS